MESMELFIPVQEIVLSLLHHPETIEIEEKKLAWISYLGRYPLRSQTRLMAS